MAGNLYYELLSRDQQLKCPEHHLVVCGEPAQRLHYSGEPVVALAGGAQVSLDKAVPRKPGEVSRVARTFWGEAPEVVGGF